MASFSATASAAVIYGTASFAARTNLYTLSADTGLATLVGGTGTFTIGLAFSPNGNLYGAGSSLVSINPETGFATIVGALPELIVSITFDAQGGLWGLGNGTNTLWKINPSTGQFIGGAFMSGPAAAGVRSISFDSQGNLFGINSGRLFNINPTTFTSTLVSNLTPCCSANGLAFSPDGQLFTSALYPESPSVSTLSLVNLQTGVLTAIGPATLTPPALQMGSLAIQVSPIPEVGTFALFGAGLLGVLLLRRRAGAAA